MKKLRSILLKNALFGLCLLFMNSLSAQYNSRFQQEYFFGNLPSAKMEAMGRADVAIGGSVPSIFINPAGIGSIEGQELALSTSAPFYVLKESDYYFAGYARRILPNLVAAVSVNQFAVGPTDFDVTINGRRYPLATPTSTNLGLSVAAEPLNGLHVGLNANYFNWNLFDDISSAKTLHFDLGTLYDFALPNTENQHLRLGASVSNFGSTSITYQSPAGDEDESAFPVTARVGIAYVIETQIDVPGAGEGPLALTFTTEYHNILNSPDRTTFLTGVEALIWQVLAVRIGYFTQKVDDLGNTDNRDRITDFTYGFGIQIPFSELTQGRIPFLASLDYVSLKQPSYVYGGRRNPNMRSLTVGLAWPIGNK